MIASAILALSVWGQALPGSRLTVAEAERSAHSIVVASLRSGLFTGTGCVTVGSGDLEVRETLKRPDRDIRWSGLGLVASEREAMPRAGEVLVFFVGESRGRDRVIKVITRADSDRTLGARKPAAVVPVGVAPTTGPAGSETERPHPGAGSTTRLPASRTARG